MAVVDASDYDRKSLLARYSSDVLRLARYDADVLRPRDVHKV